MGKFKSQNFAGKREILYKADLYMERGAGKSKKLQNAAGKANGMILHT